MALHQRESTRGPDKRLINAWKKGHQHPRDGGVMAPTSILRHRHPCDRADSRRPCVKGVGHGGVESTHRHLPPEVHSFRRKSIAHWKPSTNVFNKSLPLNSGAKT